MIAFEDPERFELLLSELSATFVTLPSDQVDDQLDEGLRRIVESLDIERGTWAQVSEDKQRLCVTHSYSIPGFSVFPKTTDLASLLPWYAGMILKGNVLRFNRILDELPEAAGAERKYCKETGLLSNLLIPFRVGEVVIGAVSFASHRREIQWSDHLVQCLRLVASVFGSALARKQAEQEAARLRYQLAHVGRLTAMGEVTASIAHEVNQPLGAIVSNAQAALRFLARTPLDATEVAGALTDIVDDATRASALLTRIRGFLQRRPPVHAPVDVNLLVKQVVGLLRGEMARREIRLDLHIAEALPPSVGDPVQLQQVIVNLLINGAEAMEDLEPEQRRLELRTFSEGNDRIGVVLRDYGRGLPPHALSRLFDPFFSTKPDGLGMGLAICRSIIEAHHGRIAPLASDGSGTTIQFTLPVSPAAAA